MLFGFNYQSRRILAFNIGQSLQKVQRVTTYVSNSFTRMEEEDFGASEFSPHDHLTTLVAASPSAAPTAVEGSIYSKKQPQAGAQFRK